MAAGGARPGAGRKKGSTSKDIMAARAAIANFCNLNSKKLQNWFDKVAEEDPARALEIFHKYLEFYMPKLARTDMSSKVDGDIKKCITVEFVETSAAKIIEHASVKKDSDSESV